MKKNIHKFCIVFKVTVKLFLIKFVQAEKMSGKEKKRVKATKKTKIKGLSQETSQKIISLLKKSINFGPKIGIHYTIGFNSISASLLNNNKRNKIIECIIMNQNVPNSIQQYLFEASKLQNIPLIILSKNLPNATNKNQTSLFQNNNINSNINIESNYLDFLAKYFKIKQISCLATIQNKSNESNDILTQIINEINKEIFSNNCNL